MPRPRRDSEILPAKERMENAFWELLSDREYRKITVTDIVQVAQVNRNSFYYHFSGLPELADSAILHLVESTQTALPKSSAETPFSRTDIADVIWKTRILELLQSPAQRQRLDRLALIAGQHGSPELLDSLRDFSRLTIANAMQIDKDHIDLKTDLLLDFTVGGILAILRRWPQLSGSVDLEDLLDQDIAMLAMGMYLSISKADMLDYWKRIFNTGSSSTGSAKTSGITEHRHIPQR